MVHWGHRTEEASNGVEAHPDLPVSGSSDPVQERWLVARGCVGGAVPMRVYVRVQCAGLDHVVEFEMSAEEPGDAPRSRGSGPSASRRMHGPEC